MIIKNKLMNYKNNKTTTKVCGNNTIIIKIKINIITIAVLIITIMIVIVITIINNSNL